MPVTTTGMCSPHSCQLFHLVFLPPPFEEVKGESSWMDILHSAKIKIPHAEMEAICSFKLLFKI